VKKILLDKSLSTLRAMFALMAAAFLSFASAASAAGPTTICFPTGNEEGPAYQCDQVV
jgi:hypothetical protein